MTGLSEAVLNDSDDILAASLEVAGLLAPPTVPALTHAQPSVTNSDVIASSSEARDGMGAGLMSEATGLEERTLVGMREFDSVLSKWVESDTPENPKSRRKKSAKGSEGSVGKRLRQACGCCCGGYKK